MLKYKISINYETSISHISADIHITHPKDKKVCLEELIMVPIDLF